MSTADECPTPPASAGVVHPPAATMPAIVLAGERAGGSALARTLGVDAGILADVAGRTCIARVIATLRASGSVAGGVIVGPAAHVRTRSPVMQELLAGGDFVWAEPAAGPSASALSASARIDTFPLLLTAGDHALLTPATVDRFCAAARAAAADFVVGLVPYSRVRETFPHSRRTLLRFRDGVYCGSNLFLMNRAAARLALEFWRLVESERKRPWRIAARIGPMTALRYLARRLPIGDAFACLSERSGAAIDYVAVDDPRAAVDVDSLADLALAREVLGSA